MNNPLKYSDPTGYRYTYQDYMREKAEVERQNRASQFSSNYVGWWQDLQKSYSEGAWQYYVSSAFTSQFPNATVNFNVNFSTQDLGSWVQVKQTEFVTGKMTISGYMTGEAQITMQFIPYIRFNNNPSSGGGDDPSLLRKAWDYTYGAPLDFIGGAYDFAKNYHDMRKLNLKNSDKYFHSKANFQATKRGPGGAFFAIHFSNLREIWDQKIKGDTWFDSMADQDANMYGRELGWDYRYKKKVQLIILRC